MKTIFCHNCGNEEPIGSAFCAKCGQPFHKKKTLFNIELPERTKKEKRPDSKILNAACICILLAIVLLFAMIPFSKTSTNVLIFRLIVLSVTVGAVLMTINLFTKNSTRKVFSAIFAIILTLLAINLIPQARISTLYRMTANEFYIATNAFSDYAMTMKNAGITKKSNNIAAQGYKMELGILYGTFKTSYDNITNYDRTFAESLDLATQFSYYESQAVNAINYMETLY